MQTVSLRSHIPTSARGPHQPARAGEKRAAPRIPAALVPLVTGVSLSPCGGTASLVNISSTGAGLKSNAGLSLGTVVTLKLEGAISVRSINGRVSRCGVVEIESGVIWYHIGIAFDEPISIEETEVPPAQAAPVPSAPQALAARTSLSNRW